MSLRLTLPSLQTMLDQLPNGQTLALTRTQADELFGLNDAGAARLRRFASGHHCAIAYVDSRVVFEKRIAR